MDTITADKVYRFTNWAREFLVTEDEERMEILGDRMHTIALPERLKDLILAALCRPPV